MRYHSTGSDQTISASLEDVILNGYAADGGLFMPDEIPTLPNAFLKNLSRMTLQEVSYAVANYALQGDVEASVLHDIVFDTINFPMPLIDLGHNKMMMELFHGPTLNFKDVGARFMARLVAYFYGKKRNKQPVNVLVATSGNSGGAIANGFYNIPGVNVIVIYPKDELTTLQRTQFTSLGGNVHAIEVNGSLADCKQMEHMAFSDNELKSKLLLTSAKTANLGRLLPQTFFYFWAYAQLLKQGRDVSNLVFAVPSGNLGNLTAGVLARKMGLPISRFIVANNKNGAMVKYLATGVTPTGEAEPSLAFAMDIAHPRNLPRILEMVGGFDNLCRIATARKYDDEEIMRTIASAWSDHRYMLNPHSATAYQALFDELQPGEMGIAMATSHPARTVETVESAIGETVDVPETLLKFFNGGRHVTRINSGYNSLRKLLLSNL